MRKWGRRSWVKKGGADWWVDVSCRPVVRAVVACLFVTKDNAAGMGLYEKLGYVRVAADFTRKRFRPLLHAGAIDVRQQQPLLQCPGPT